MASAFLLIGQEVHPLRRTLGHHNEAFLSPWSGEVWARLVHQPQGLWYALHSPALGEPSYALQIPGSLYNPWLGHLQGYREYPRPILMRELSVIEAFDRATLLCHNVGQSSPASEPVMNPEALTSDIAALRAKALAGTITDDELAQALAMLRQHRVSASAASASSRSKKDSAKSPPPSAADVLALF